MELMTTSLPPGYKLIENLGLVSTYTPIQITQKGLFQSIADRNRNEFQEAYEQFTNSAPRSATIIFGIQISTAVGSFSNGGYMYVTIVGTAGIHEKISDI